MATSKKELQRQTHQENVLMGLGFTQAEAEQLRRISMTLRRWHELECGTGDGCIARDEKTGVPYWFNANSRFVQANDRRAYSRIPDREKGALARLNRIFGDRNRRIMLPELGKAAVKRTGPVRGLCYYIQTDPRGAALYILRPGDVPAGESPDGYYSRGICVY